MIEFWNDFLNDKATFVITSISVFAIIGLSIVGYLIYPRS